MGRTEKEEGNELPCDAGGGKDVLVSTSSCGFCWSLPLLFLLLSITGAVVSRVRGGGSVAVVDRSFAIVRAGISGVEQQWLVGAGAGAADVRQKQEGPIFRGDARQFQPVRVCMPFIERRAGEPAGWLKSCWQRARMLVVRLRE